MFSAKEQIWKGKGEREEDDVLACKSLGNNSKRKYHRDIRLSLHTCLQWLLLNVEKAQKALGRLLEDIIIFAAV